jgi:putative pyruvate formate lyase activating enzyme
MNPISSEPLYLKRYYQVAADKLPAQFQISGSLCVDFNKEAPLDELWGVHGEAMKLFREKLENTTSVDELKPCEGTSLLDLKVELANRILSECHFCERRCGINRRKKEIGYCGIDAVSRYSAEFLHTGEEPELVPSHTIFFTGCNFSCVYCQNWEISTSPGMGHPILLGELARTITMRRAYGSRNVNFVTPTPHTHVILKVLNALKKNVPVVWNSNMYYSQETARLLEGAVDVYLGDFRYGNDECAMKYSNAPDYMGIVTRNFSSAYESGEILLRHLLLPNHLECCTRPVVQWTEENIPHVRFNLMFQYAPHYRAREFPEINRYLTPDECQKAIDIVRKAGLADVLL